MTTAGQGRMAAVLFTDLVGSTELLSRLGEAAFDGLRRAHFAALREAIGHSCGAEVKTTGDGLLATFSSAADAVGCAVGMQQAVEVHGRTADVPLAIRVGVSVGDVVFEDGDVFGTPLVEAARLVAAARGGQILATALVRGIAGSRSTAGFTDVGCLELKGLSAPVAACEVAWEPLRAPAVPLPPLLTGLGRIFVGRDGEMEHLEGCWKQVRAGEQRVVLVAGEPGVGKTRLAAQLAARAHAEGATVLAGRCDEDLGVPYQPFVEALRQIVDHTPAGDLSRSLGRYAGELARLVPELTRHLPGLPPPLTSDPETERYRLFDAVAAWLAASSAQQPLLLVLDDLQWAAKPTLLLLRHVLRSTEAMSLLVLAMYRDTEVGRTHPLGELLADLRRLEGVERVSLLGLDQPAVAAFLEHAAGHELGEEKEELVSVIHRETEGNAFFVREIVRHLIETGGLVQREGRWMVGRPIAEMGIPEGVRDVVGRRLSRLSVTANQALGLGAVAGEEFELAIIEEAASLPEDALLSALDEAVRARLIAEIPGPLPRYRFAHALVRATLYEELSGARRVALHRRVGEAIEKVHVVRLDDYLPALAHHFAKAAGAQADARKAVSYARGAGDLALAQLANDEAANYYREALELLDSAERPVDQGQRLELLIALGEAERRGGNPAHRQTLLDAAQLAQASGDAGALARAALANSRGAVWSWSGVVDAERVAVLDSALGHTNDTDTATRARLLADLGVEVFWSADRDPAPLSDRALELARRADDQATLAHVLYARLFATLTPDRWAERWADSAQLLRVADSLADPAVTWKAHFIRAISAMEMGDVEEFDRCLDVAERVAVELGQTTLRWITSWPRIGRVLLSGRFAEAEQLSLEALALAESSGQRDARDYFRPQRFQILFEQGRLSELEASLARGVTRHPGRLYLESLLAVVYAELDKESLARLMLERLAAATQKKLPKHPETLRILTSLAVVAARLHDRSMAYALYDVLLPYADLIDCLWGAIVGGAVVHYVGMVATVIDRFDEAEQRFAAAAATHTRIGAPTWLARTRMEWACMLLTRRDTGDAERARELLGEALTTARELGLVTVERRCVALLTEGAAR